jgi:hypothetical protein
MSLGGRSHATFTAVDDYKDRGGPTIVVGACFLISGEEGENATT